MIFSMPVWRYPITGLSATTVSPSSSMISRSTPWVEGCCGPMLIVIVLNSGAVAGADIRVGALHRSGVGRKHARAGGGLSRALHGARRRRRGGGDGQERHLVAPLQLVAVDLLLELHDPV